MIRSLITRQIISRPARIAALSFSTARNGVFSLSAAGIESEPRSSKLDLEQPRTPSFPRSMSVSLRRPEQKTLEWLIYSLKKKFRIPNARWVKELKPQEKGPGLVILATPKFAQWLTDDENFVSRVVETVTRIPDGRVEPVEVDVLCACVDGISNSLEFIPEKATDLEGFSFFLGNVSQIFPDLWDEERPSTSDGEGRSSLTFSGQAPWESNVTVPLANTLFQIGTVSHLQASKWKRTTDQSLFKISTKNKTHQTINVFDGMVTNSVFGYIPASPLTAARPIVSGLGNIVREIDFGPDGVRPASLELEESVDQYRKYVAQKFGSLACLNSAVWALVVPGTAAKSCAPLSPFALQMSINEGEKAKSGKMDHEYIGYWINQGAVLCRVLSGGGGWGVKQGLLSLDPQISYNNVEEPNLALANGSVEQQQLSGFGNIAKPGSYIQFFVTDPRTSPGHHLKENFLKRRTVVFGTIPSTMDDVPADSADDPDQPYMRTRRRHFGCVSQSGIYIENKKPGSAPVSLEAPSCSSKIDLPHSYVYNWVAPDPKQEI